MSNENIYICEAVYGGDLDDIPTVMSNNDKPLHCNICFDKSLYHDSFAYWAEDSNDLLCQECYEKDKIIHEGYIEVLTQH